MKTQRRTVCLLLFINLFWFLIIALLSQLAPVHSDDVILTQIYGTEQRIQSVRDFFYSIRTHQQLWGGQPVGWGFEQLIALAPRIVFSLGNALAWVGTANLICRYAGTRLETDPAVKPPLLALVYLSLWFFFPSLYDAFWLNAAICYFWFNTLTLLFGYRFFDGSACRIRRDGPAWKNVCSGAALFVSGFAVGACISPPAGSTLLAAMGLGALWAFFRNKPFSIPLFAAAFLGTLLGFCVSTFSPGNAARVAYVAAQSPNTSSFLFRIARASYYGLRYTLIPLGITLFFAALNRRRFRWEQLDELFFVLLAAINIAVMAIPNGYSPRTVLFSVMLLIVAGARSAVRFVSASPRCQEDRRALKTALWLLIAALTAFALLEIATGLLLHFTQGTAFDRQTIYFSQYFELF